MCSPTSTETGSIIRWGHLDAAELIRPDPHEPWRLIVKHDHGLTTVRGDDGLRTAGKVLAALNAAGALPDDVRRATAKIEDAEDEQGYFSRIVALAMRTGWGRFPDAPLSSAPVAPTSSAAERLALHITNRSFWGRGSITSEPSTLMLRLPLVDRLALEMAANEDTERRALAGELLELERAWRTPRRSRRSPTGCSEARSSRSSARTTRPDSSRGRAARRLRLEHGNGLRRSHPTVVMQTTRSPCGASRQTSDIDRRRAFGAVYARPRLA